LPATKWVAAQLVNALDQVVLTRNLPLTSTGFSAHRWRNFAVTGRRRRHRAEAAAPPQRGQMQATKSHQLTAHLRVLINNKPKPRYRSVPGLWLVVDKHPTTVFLALAAIAQHLGLANVSGLAVKRQNNPAGPRLLFSNQLYKINS